MLRVRGVVLPFAFAVCLLMAGAGAADDDDAPGPAAKGGRAYPIRLTRPMKVGQQYRWTADSTLLTTLPGAAPDTVSVRFDAVVQILGLDKNGECMEMAATVEECTARTGREKKTVVKPGRVILVEAGKWKPKLTPTTGTLTIDEDVLLRSVLFVPRADDTTDDDVFGSAKPQAVGASWSIRTDQFVRSWAAAGYRLQAHNVSGNVKVKSAEVVDGSECVRVAGRATIENFLPPALDIPDGLPIGHATCEVKFTKLLPIDPSRQPLVDSHSMSVRFQLKRDPRALTAEKREGRLLRTVGVKLQLIPG